MPPVCRLNSHRKLEQSLTIIGAVVLALVVCVSRVRLGYHSKEQVAVGALVGALAGVAWQIFVAKVQRAILTTSHTLASHSTNNAPMNMQISPWLFPLLAQTQVAQFFYIRDTSHVPDLIVFQHELCLKPATVKVG